MAADSERAEWTLVATLRHRPGRPTIVSVATPDGAIDPEAWSRTEGWCEQCRTRRARRTTYLLRRADGRLAQVGSSCLTAFTGQPAATILGPSRTRPRQRRGGDGPASPAEYVPTLTYLAHVAQAVHDFGFTPAAAGTRERPPTWQLAAVAIDHRHAPSSEADRRAVQALAWIRTELAGRHGLPDFEQRLVETLRQDRLTRRELPTAAAAIYAFHRHLRHVIAARSKAGAYLGTPGDLITTRLNLKRVDRVATPRGPVHRHLLIDELGRRAIWDSPAEELPPGIREVEAIVGEQITVEGCPVTVLGECRPAA